MSPSSSSSLEESQALLRLKAGGLHDPLPAEGGLGGESATTYKLGEPMEILEHVATGDLLLLLLCGGMSSCSPGCTLLSTGNGSATGLMCTLFACTHRRRGGLTCSGPGKFAWILAGVQELHLLFGLHVAGELAACDVSTSDTISTLLLLPSSFPSILLFRFIVRVVAQARVVVSTVGAIFSAPKLVEASVEHPEYSKHYWRGLQSRVGCSAYLCAEVYRS